MNTLFPTPINKFTDVKSCFVIIIVCFFAFFINNDIIPADLMESRNLVTAQEMVRTGNYLVPTMNGELRLEKPPLPTWIAAGVESLSPQNLSAQRYVSGLVATLMAIFLYLLMRKMTKDSFLSLIAAVVLVTSYNVIMMGRTATWDIYSHSFMLIAIYLIVCAFDHKGKQFGRLIGAGIFMGLSFLSKGPIAFYALFLPFIISYVFIIKPNIKGKSFSIIAMIVICLFISFWWPCYILFFHPEASLAVGSKESSSWLNHNTRPFWYYWGFAAESGIWALFWISSIVYFFWKKEVQNRTIYSFSILWMFIALILLSVIPEKKTRYLLPLLIPGAINIAFYLWYNIRGKLTKGTKKLFQINGLLIGIISIGLPIAFYFLFVRERALSWTNFIVITIIFFIIAICLFTGILRKKAFKPIRVFQGTALVMIIFLAICFQPVSKLIINQEGYSIANLKNKKEVENLPFYYKADGEIRMEIVYQANRNILPIDLKNDSLIYASLPFVLVSSESANTLLEGKNVSIKYIDTYDNNWLKPQSKRYNDNLVKQVAIISKK